MTSISRAGLAASLNLSDVGSPQSSRANLQVTSLVSVSDANYSPTSADKSITWTSISAPRNCNLPAASSMNPGETLLIRDGSGNASTSNTITLVRNGSDTMEGTTVQWVINLPRGFFTIESDGVSDWKLVSASTYELRLTATGAGTWVKPPGYKRFQVELYGPGSGGGSGRRGAALSLRTGGAGGGPGSYSSREVLAHDLGATEAYNVGLGGGGGAAQTVDNTDGIPGSVAATGTVFASANAACRVQAAPGAIGGAGNASGAATGGKSGTADHIGTQAGGSSASGGNGGTGSGPVTNASAGSGGAGGGITTGDAEGTGGGGGSSSPRYGLGNPGNQGNAAGTIGTAGGSPTDASAGYAIGGPGGGGGGASKTAAAGAGGAGARYGGGGGGGGASLNGFASGAGGSGAPGIIVIRGYMS